MAVGFEHARAGLRATAASVTDHDIVDVIDRHGRQEEELLTRYERFIENAESPVVQYLVRMIVEDERRHHQILEELANTIAWGSFGHPDGPALPATSPHSPAGRELRAETWALLRHELTDRRELRRLGRRFERYGEVPLWSLLVEAMGWDTDKHISILRFILASQRRPGLGPGLRRTARRLRAGWTR